jgi:hypothetical protein
MEDLSQRTERMDLETVVRLIGNKKQGREKPRTAIEIQYRESVDARQPALAAAQRLRLGCTPVGKMVPLLRTRLTLCIRRAFTVRSLPSGTGVFRLLNSYPIYPPAQTARIAGALDRLN